MLGHFRTAQLKFLPILRILAFNILNDNVNVAVGMARSLLVGITERKCAWKPGDGVDEPDDPAAARGVLDKDNAEP